MKKQIVPALILFLAMTILTGILYPLSVTVIAQVFFKDKANGSLTMINGRIIGSELIAQKFENPKYFWPRPSAIDYNSLSSGASNWGPTSADLKAKLEERRLNGLTNDMLYASGSGLDPHISPLAAKAQVARVARERGLSNNALIELIEKHIEQRQMGFLGESRVNVLKLNLSLNHLSPDK
ncbi:MAG: potassium-transporting ATPase subunit KdpC [Bdellovibrionota bacterium]